VKEGIAETPEESKERLIGSDLTKGSDKPKKYCIFLYYLNKQLYLNT